MTYVERVKKLVEGGFFTNEKLAQAYVEKMKLVDERLARQGNEVGLAAVLAGYGKFARPVNWREVPSARRES